MHFSMTCKKCTRLTNDPANVQSSRGHMYVSFKGFLTSSMQLCSMSLKQTKFISMAVNFVKINQGISKDLEGTYSV